MANAQQTRVAGFAIGGRSFQRIAHTCWRMIRRQAQDVTSMASQRHEAIRAAQIKESQPFSNHKPSDATVSSGWIYALRKKDRNKYPRDSERSGKWLIFASTQSVDEIWLRIKKAVESGVLGNRAKVAPIRCASIDRYTGRKCQVICVYTHDWKDREDVMHIRDKLRELGITEILSYKTDADTEAGKYRWNGDRNISKYRA